MTGCLARSGLSQTPILRREGGEARPRWGETRRGGHHPRLTTRTLPQPTDQFWSRREKIQHGGFQCLAQANQFEIRHPPDLRFDLGERLPTDVPAKEIQFRHQHRLGEAMPLAQLSYLRANHVARSFHVPNSELDASRKMRLLGSEFGTAIAEAETQLTELETIKAYVFTQTRPRSARERGKNRRLLRMPGHLGTRQRRLRHHWCRHHGGRKQPASIG